MHMSHETWFQNTNSSFWKWMSGIEYVLTCVRITTNSMDLVNKANLVHNLFSVYLFLVYLSISTYFGWLCPSSGETTVFMWHFVLVIMCGWLSGMQGGKNELINILRINIPRINCAPSWLYLQDCTGMHSQQNIKLHGAKSFLNS